MAHSPGRPPQPLIPLSAGKGSGFAAWIAALDKNTTYAVYCHSGNRSGTALEQMTAAGFTHVYDLAGGIGAWQNMGGPMATGGP
jgi:phage shock protein E